MIRTLLITLFCLGSLFAATGNIDKKISKTAKQLKGFDKKHTSLHSKMAKNAKEILQQKSMILQQQKKLKRLTRELALAEQSYKSNKDEIEQLIFAQHELSRQQSETEQKLVFAIARNVSLSMLIDDNRTVNADAMITEAVIRELTKQVRKEIRELNAQFRNYGERINELSTRSKNLKNEIAQIDTKREELLTTQTRNKKALAQLETDEAIYKKSVKKLLNQQSELKKTLSHLNVIKRKAVEKKKEEAARKRQQAALAKRKAMVDETDLPDVKKVGSSYQKTKTKRYRGKKTIAPLDKYKVVKKYGPYTDPIYKIKIFNESVSLKPKSSGAKVKNVLNGKIIFANETAVLNNVIVVEHSQGIHTIYANLDKIAPTIKVGKKIKKGYVIGRVNDELVFEVTQKNYHINPLQLIN